MRPATFVVSKVFATSKNNLQSSNNFSETKKCWTHGDCPRHLRCTNGFCGDRTYFEALKNRQCEDDSICEVRYEPPETVPLNFITFLHQQLLTGEMCCYDLAGAKWWSEGKMRLVVEFCCCCYQIIIILRFEKKCCNNPSGHPVLRPTRHLDRQQMIKVTLKYYALLLFEL